MEKHNRFGNFDTKLREKPMSIMRNSMLRKISKFLYPSIFKYESWFHEQSDKRNAAECENRELKQ
jgi:hypothetical protein